MNRYFSLALLGFAGLFLATPQMSLAQTPVAVPVQVSPGTVTYQPGYTYVAPRYVVAAPAVVAPTVIVGAPVYSPWYWNGHSWYRGYHYGHYVHRR